MEAVINSALQLHLLTRNLLTNDQLRMLLGHVAPDYSLTLVHEPNARGEERDLTGHLSSFTEGNRGNKLQRLAS